MGIWNLRGVGSRGKGIKKESFFVSFVSYPTGTKGIKTRRFRLVFIHLNKGTPNSPLPLSPSPPFPTPYSLLPTPF